MSLLQSNGRHIHRSHQLLGRIKVEDVQLYSAGDTVHILRPDYDSAEFPQGNHTGFYSCNFTVGYPTYINLFTIDAGCQDNRFAGIEICIQQFRYDLIFKENIQRCILRQNLECNRCLHAGIPGSGCNGNRFRLVYIFCGNQATRFHRCKATSLRDFPIRHDRLIKRCIISRELKLLAAEDIGQVLFSTHFKHIGERTPCYFTAITLHHIGHPCFIIFAVISIHNQARKDAIAVFCGSKLRRISEESNSLQSAVRKCAGANTGHTDGKHDFFQFAAVVECIVTDGVQAVSKGNAAQAAARSKQVIRNLLHRVAQLHVLQIGTVGEHTVTQIIVSRKYRFSLAGCAVQNRKASQIATAGERNFADIGHIAGKYDFFQTNTAGKCRVADDAQLVRESNTAQATAFEKQVIRNPLHGITQCHCFQIGAVREHTIAQLISSRKCKFIPVVLTVQNRKVFQVAASRERNLANVGHTAGKFDCFQIATTGKCRVADGVQAIREGNAAQSLTLGKQVIRNHLHGVAQLHGLQIGTVRENTITPLIFSRKRKFIPAVLAIQRCKAL